MQPGHPALVVNAAWLLLTLLRQSDSRSVALQAYVFEALAAARVTQRLSASAPKLPLSRAEALLQPAPASAPVRPLCVAFPSPL